MGGASHSTGTVSRRLSNQLPSDFLLQLDREATLHSVLQHWTQGQGSEVRGQTQSNLESSSSLDL